MKLLEKRTINAGIQAERKSIIDSGVFLAKKVDTLREDLLSLEKQRADFIESSRKQLQEAIGDLKNEKSNLDFEVQEAIKRLAKLREPLDEEWNKLEQIKDEVIKTKLESETFFQAVVKERNELSKQKELVDILEKSATDYEHKTYQLLEKTEQDRRETKRFFEEAKQLKEIKEAELYVRELSLESKQKNLSEREEKLKKEKIEFNKEKKALSIKKQRYEKS